MAKPSNAFAEAFAHEMDEAERAWEEHGKAEFNRQAFGGNMTDEQQTVDPMALAAKGPVVEIGPEGILVTFLIPWSQVVQVVPDEAGD